MLLATSVGSSPPPMKCVSMPSTTIAARRRAKMMDLASMTMTQGSFSQRYASQNIQEHGTWVRGALFVLSVVLSCGANIGIVAAFGQVTASLCEVPCRAVGSTIHSG